MAKSRCCLAMSSSASGFGTSIVVHDESCERVKVAESEEEETERSRGRDEEETERSRARSEVRVQQTDDRQQAERSGVYALEVVLGRKRERVGSR
jgi:ribonuclease BN (tRNA processing enzyme)